MFARLSSSASCVPAAHQQAQSNAVAGSQVEQGPQAEATWLQEWPQGFFECSDSFPDHCFVTESNRRPSPYRGDGQRPNPGISGRSQ